MLCYEIGIHFVGIYEIGILVVASVYMKAKEFIQPIIALVHSCGLGMKKIRVFHLVFQSGHLNIPSGHLVILTPTIGLSGHLVISIGSSGYLVKPMHS